MHSHERLLVIIIIIITIITVHQRHGQTDGRTNERLTVAISLNAHSASRGKNCSEAVCPFL